MSMADHTTSDKMKPSEYVEVEWRSYILHVPSEESDVHKTGLPIWDDFVVFMYHGPASFQFYIPL